MTDLSKKPNFKQAGLHDLVELTHASHAPSLTCLPASHDNANPLISHYNALSILHF